MMRCLVSDALFREWGMVSGEWGINVVYLSFS